MPYNTYIAAWTVVHDVEEEERKRREAAELLGEDWTVVESEGSIPDASAA